MTVQLGAPEADPAPFGGSPDDNAELATAKQSTLVWRAFKKHRLAMAGMVVVALLYLVAIFAEFLAPFSTSAYNADYAYAPPQRVHVVDTSGGSWEWGLHVNGYTATTDAETLERTYVIDPSKRIPVRLFAQSEPYRMWGFIPADRHLIGPVDRDQPMYLLGADRNGRDLFSRIIHGTRVSMSIGLVGVALAFLLGVVLGGVSGYFGGKVDTVIQRVVEFFMSIPTLPLWLGLAAALPGSWGPLQRYFAITVILAIIAWTDLARVTRGRFLSLREEEFVTAASLDGNTIRD